MNIEKKLKADSELPLAKNVVVNLLYTYGLVNNVLNEALKPAEITIQQFNVLRILRGQSGKPSTLANVQERMINKMSNTTRLIDKLVKKGYVMKNINQKNKRKVDIIITKQGLNFLSEIDSVIDRTEQKIIEHLVIDEAQQLIRLLGKLRLIVN